MQNPATRAFRSVLVGIYAEVKAAYEARNSYAKEVRHGLEVSADRRGSADRVSAQA